MFWKQMTYFQAVVNTHSFSEAAELCHISQSAISQQIKALEEDLGVQLLSRHGRSFSLTPAGEYFYKKSLILLSDEQDIRRELRRMTEDVSSTLKIGYLSGFVGDELQRAVSAFSVQHPAVTISLMDGSHEDLYDALRHNQIDMAFSDQRRAFYSDYHNLILREAKTLMAISVNHPLSHLASVEVAELKNIPCILVTTPQRMDSESRFYRDVIGIKSPMILAKNLSEAKLLVASQQGYLPLEGVETPVADSGLHALLLTKNGTPVLHNYCLFWKKDSLSPYCEEFSKAMQAAFS